MPNCYLGVDGGQSSTTALVGGETGAVLGYGRGGPCNHVSGPEARTRFINAIGGCVKQALEAAGLAPDTPIEAACFGFSGGPADKEEIVAGMFVMGKRFVTTDALIALSGAHAGGPGVIAIAGTGSIAFGRNAQGKVVRAGGWGYVFGDEGGGFDLTRQALRAALRHEEGWGPPTALHKLLLEATGAKNANEVLHRFYTPDFPRPRVAALSRLVGQAAGEGDRIAAGIIDDAAAQLAGLTAAARRQIFAEGETAKVAPIGGVFKTDRILERFRYLVELSGGAAVVQPTYPPAAGALCEAYRIAGLAVTLSDVPEFEK
jgi:N-acetylglucosamine kinase-like BadF-type ATPase